MNLQNVELSELIPDDANPRVHDDKNLDAIRASLKEHGQVEPLVVQEKTMKVIGGNGRLTVLKTLGETHADVVLLDVNDEQARKLSISLNRSGELAGWDEQTLAMHLQDLYEADGVFDPTSLGFSGEEMESLLAQFAGDLEALALAAPEEEYVGEGGPNDLPDGAQPEHMPNSSVRMVQLFLDEHTAPIFQLWVNQLAKKHGTDNITDTVYLTIQAAAEALE
jgi:ParB-like chromosome segregation protein Spo0J